MAYNFNKPTCDRCGVRKDEVEESFRLALDGGMLCANCHREKLLASILDKPLKESKD